MFNVTLIASVHKERGICNSNELYKIINRVDPEIIFEEFSRSGFLAIYEGSRNNTLETSTIKRYLQKHKIAQFPVDLDGDELLDIQTKKDIIEMFDIFDRSPEYKGLSIQHEILSESIGFPYLNSSQCKEILDREHFLEKDILRMINHDKLFQTYRVWLDINNNRENEMIKNIYSYSSLNNYNRGLFLVGAEHRKEIMDKLSKTERINKPELNWIFDYFN
jgi:hypothetical protein